MNGRKSKVAKKAKHAKHAKGKRNKKSSTLEEKIVIPKEKESKQEEIIEEIGKEHDNLKVMEEELSQDMKKQKKLPKEELKKLNKRILSNMALAIAIIFYLLLLNIGALNIETATYMMDLKVFSMLFIAITIIIFEVSYKKDSGILCIYGIEILVLAVLTLVLPTLYSVQKEHYGMILTGALIIFTIYYIIKAFMIYRKGKKEQLKKVSDINEIIKKK